MAKGDYRYRYQLADSILESGGLFKLRSPNYVFQVHSYSFDSWQFWVMTGVLLFLIMCALSSSTARMQGTLSTDGESQMINAKHFMSEATFNNRFALKAKRFCFVKSSLVFKVTAGFVRVDGRLLPTGQKINLYPAQVHAIEHDEGNRRVERQLLVNV